MAAPNAALLAALRSGDRCARHLFFKLAHSQGAVCAWDGLGEREFNGSVYLGIANMGTIQGVSQSRDLQTAEVLVTLSGVPFPALQQVDPSIRNCSAQIDAVWISEGGSAVASKRIFTGLGNYLTTSFGERSLTITARLRGRMADWSRAPQSYYTSAEQGRNFAGDTGFDYIKTLENTTVSGWGEFEESTGGLVKTRNAYLDSNSGAVVTLYPSIALNRVIGSDESGAFHYKNTSGSPTVLRPVGNNALTWVDDNATYGLQEATGVDAVLNSFVTYVAVAGTVHSSDTGRYVKVQTTGKQMRLAGAIASIGVATATTFAPSTGVGAAAVQVVGWMAAGGAALSTINSGTSPWKNVAFIESNGRYLFNNAGTVQAKNVAGATAMVEEISGNAVTVSGGLMKCNGANVVLSTTGVLLTDNNRRIIPSGGNASIDFARTWT